MITVKNITKYFDGIQAVRNVSLTIKEGSITGLIGPNGAGKTTLFNLIAGIYKPDSGSIYLEQEDITGNQPHTLFKKGVLRTFQIAHEFPSLSVKDNLMVVPGDQFGERIVNSWFASRIIREQEIEYSKKADEVIEFLQLESVATEYAGNLSGGQKKLLELGRTMMADPKIVFLDEVGAGVNRTLLKSIRMSISRLNKELGYTFCMIEHDMDFISNLCDPIIVMSNGSVLIEGDSQTIFNDEKVIDAYLGKSLNLD